ncbi:hypothetical protein DU508_05000 [Pedobacter chinensis]|uniref:Uncharacterized protein n=1 Tax=Pedobacter chinensis TaxID=2282421 RepID=A0A369Q491_9SPHI|nr:hypothetical protein DU508_05000 [Pedobacter chinensis]
MNNSTEPQIIDTCKRLASRSAILGTLIFVCFAIIRIPEMMFFGLMYILFAGLINGIFFIALAVSCFTNKAYWQKIVATMIFMLANIPLSIFYSFLAFML